MLRSVFVLACLLGLALPGCLQPSEPVEVRTCDTSPWSVVAITFSLEGDGPWALDAPFPTVPVEFAAALTAAMDEADSAFNVTDGRLELEGRGGANVSSVHNLSVAPPYQFGYGAGEHGSNSAMLQSDDDSVSGALSLAVVNAFACPVCGNVGYSAEWNASGQTEVQRLVPRCSAS